MPKPDRRRLLKFLAGCTACRPAYEVAAAAPASAAAIRISRYEIYQTRVPWAERVREIAILNSRRENRELLDRPHTVFKLYTDNGLVGIGEGGNEAQLKAIVGHSPWEYILHDGLGGVQTAIYDLLGKAVGLPACHLLFRQPEEANHAGLLEPELPTRRAGRGGQAGGEFGIPGAHGQNPAMGRPSGASSSHLFCSTA